MNVTDTMQATPSDTVPGLTHYQYGVHTYDLYHHAEGEDEWWFWGKFINWKGRGYSQNFPTKRAALNALDQDIKGNQQINWEA